MFSRTVATLDRAAAAATRGRTSGSEVLSGLPVLVLTSTGRRTGRARQTHLVGVPVGDELALLGTNFGQAATPSWVLNLEADPRAAVTYRGVTREVLARPATDEERPAVLAAARRVYPGYPAYQARITGRRVRVFVLEPRP